LVAIVPTAQRLDADDAAVCEVDEWLIVDYQLPLPDGRPQPLTKDHVAQQKIQGLGTLACEPRGDQGDHHEER
jgi:hypothetical protein